MKKLSINNSEVLACLTEYSDFIQAKWNSGDLVKDLHSNFHCKNIDGKEFVSLKYLDKLEKKGHEGFPEYLKGYGGLQLDMENELYNVKPAGLEYRNRSIDLSENLMMMLAAKRNSLCTIYPPSGFISWHHNANAPGYNIIFTWSETGKGWFKYKDPKTGEIVHIQDEPGWNCKMGYFGHENKDHFYHAAYTDCLRITCAYIFSDAENIWKEVIEEIEEEC